MLPVVRDNTSGSAFVTGSIVSPGPDPVPRTRSSQEFTEPADANFGFKSGTMAIGLLVVRFKHSHPVSAGTLCECLNQRTTSQV